MNVTKEVSDTSMGPLRQDVSRPLAQKPPKLASEAPLAHFCPFGSQPGA